MVDERRCYYLDKLIRWYQGYIICLFKKGDLERFFNMCHNHNIQFWNMTYNDGQCEACISLDDFWTIRKFIKKTKVRLYVKERHGLVFLFSALRKRKGLLIGASMCFAVISLLTSCIWKIEYQGNSFYTNERLTKYLYENEKIYLGMFKSKIDSVVLEENLRLKFPEISWVSVQTKGTSLIIEMEEMTRYTEKKNVASKIGIYADVDGEIVSMMTRSGIPQVSVGDQIKKGDLLIDGNMPIYDDGLNLIDEQFVGADGDIAVRIQWPVERIIYYQHTDEAYSDVKQGWAFVIGDLIYESKLKSESVYVDQPYMHYTEYWSPLKNVQLQLDTYKSYELVSALESAVCAKEDMMQEMSDMFREFNQKGVQILENNVRIDVYEDRIWARGDLELIYPIGTDISYISDSDKNEKNGELYGNNRNDD